MKRKDTHTKRAAIYIRVSREREGMVSPEIQEKEVRAMCAREDWEVAGLWSDIDISGKETSNRPGLLSLRAAYDRNEFDIAVSHTIDRLSRNMADGAEIVGNMRIASVREGIPPEDDDFMPLLHMLLAHKQRQEISKRWREAQALRLAAGKPTDGNDRFGYTYVEKTFEPDPKTAPYLREAFLRYIRGQGGFELLIQWLNEEGVTTTHGKRFTGITLRRIMDSGFAAGFIVRHHTEKDPENPEKDVKAPSTLVEGSHEPLISPAEWRQYLAQRERLRPLPAKSKSPRWLYAGFTRCGLCGGPMVVSSYTAETSAIRCSNYRTQSNTCTGSYYQRLNFERQVAGWLEEHLAEWAAATPDTSADALVLEGHLSDLTERLAGLDAQAKKLTRGWVDGLLDDDGYREVLAEVTADRETVTTERDRVQAALDDLAPGEDVYARIFDFLLGPDAERGAPQKGATTSEENRVLSKVIKEVRVLTTHLEVEDVATSTVTILHRPKRQMPDRARAEDGRFARSDQQ